MQKCNFTLSWEGEQFSFNSEWELDSFLYEKLGNLDNNELKKIKSAVIFSSDPKTATVEKIKQLQEEVKKYKVTHSIISSEDGEEIIESHYNIPNSTGVSTFIKSPIVTGTTTTAFDEEGLFSIIGVSDKSDVKSIIRSDWKKIQDYGIDFHAVLEIVGSKDEGSVDSAKKKLLKMTHGDEKLADQMMSIAEDILNTIVTKHGGMENVEVFFEMPVLSLPDENGNTVNGRLDMVVVDKNGNAHIYDFKVSPKKPGTWRNTNNRAIGTNAYSSAKKRDIDRQMAAYQSILVQRGINIASVNIVAITPETIYSGNDPIKYTVNDDEQPRTLNYGISSFGQLSWSLVESKDLNLGPHLNGMYEYFVKPEVHVNPSTVSKQMESLFPNYSPDIVSKTNTPEELVKKNFFRRIVLETEPEYAQGARFKFLDLTTSRWIFAKNDEELLEKATEYVERFNKSRTIDTRNVATAIENVLSGSVAFETFLSNSEYTDSEKSKLRQALKIYLRDGQDSEWTLLNEPQLIDNNVLVFVNASQGIADFVSITDLPLTNQAPMTHKTNWVSNYTSLYGAFKADFELESSSTLTGTYGNIELCRLMLFANSGTIDLTKYKLNSFKTVSPKHLMYGSIIELSAKTLFAGFNKLVKIANAEHNKLDDGIQIDLNINDKHLCPLIDYAAYRITQLKSKLSLERGTYDINDIISCIEWCKNQIETLLKVSDSVRNYHNGTNKNMDDPEVETFILLNDLLLHLTGHSVPFEKDKSTVTKVKGGLEVGLYVASPQLSSSKAMRTMGEITAVAFNKSASKATNYYMTKCIPIIKKYREYKGRNKFIGGEWGLDQNLFRTLEDGVTINPNLLLKDPTDASLAPEEKALLKMIFEVLDEFRYTNDAQKNAALLDGSYYWCPLIRANTKEMASNGSVKTALKTKWNDVHNFLDLFSEQMNPQMEGSIPYRVYDQFDLDLSSRQTVLTAHDVSEFSLDIDRILRTFIKTKIKNQEINRILPEVIAIHTILQYHEHLSGETNANIIAAVKDYVKLNLFDKPIMDEGLIPAYRMARVLRDMASLMSLGFNYRSGLRELMQGMWTHISRTMVELYGKDQFTVKDILKGWSIVFKLGFKDPNFIGLFEQINAEYQMANAGINEIEELINSAKTGALNFESDLLYIFNKIPDYFHRMSIFIAKMLHDGSWYSHHLNDEGVLVYDFNSDERFNLLNKPGVDTNSTEYKKQLGLYVTLRQQFIKEGYKIDSIKEGQPIPALPRAYTLQEGQSIKNFADLCFGHYDKETQMLLKHQFMGAFLLQFKTYYSAKLEQWIMGRGNYCIGSYKEVTEPDGTKLVKKITVSDQGVYEMDIVKESEVNENDMYIPHTEWTNKYMEGILYTVWDAGKALATRDWDEFKLQMRNETKRANMGIFVRDMLWAQLMISLLALLLANIEENDTSFAAYTLVAAWQNSYADGPVTNLIRGTLGDFNPPMYRTIKDTWNSTKNVLLGKKTVWQGLYSSLGALKDINKWTSN